MGRLTSVGIEKIKVYPTSVKLDLSELAKHRGYDVQYLHQELMVYERSLNPTWEDPVTMAVNAGQNLFSDDGKKMIGLLIVCTETGLDLEKSLSSWVHHYLKLPSYCRHFEIKCACYSGTAALKMALSWVQTNTRNQKALVITTDQSLHSIGKPWEYINGAGAVAMLISDQPDFVRIDPEDHGVYAHEVSDVIRPLPWIETGNSDDSLFSYIEALGGAYDHYIEVHGGKGNFETDFDYNIYHVPFSGISYRAHKQLSRYHTSLTHDDIMESFNRKTKPSLEYPKRIGGIYGGSVYLALLSVIRHAKSAKTGDRIGVFSYGSGSCAEFYSAWVTDKSKEVAQEANLDSVIDNRYKVRIEDYESFENSRVQMAKSENFAPDIDKYQELFETQYKGQNKLIYTGTKGYYRSYEYA